MYKKNLFEKFTEDDLIRNLWNLFQRRKAQKEINQDPTFENKKIRAIQSGSTKDGRSVTAHETTGTVQNDGNKEVIVLLSTPTSGIVTIDKGQILNSSLYKDSNRSNGQAIWVIDDED